MNQPTLEGTIFGDSTTPLQDKELLGKAKNDIVMGALGTMAFRFHTH
ncbi:hypothetical protein QUF81_15690 [Peribacillus simplex]|nr:hypothetical protein [Peribacillus simplex]MDM5294611.1 hypothetical protein [Peribacillus simplex]